MQHHTLGWFVGADGRLRAGWRFAVSVVVTLLVNTLALGIAAHAGTSMRRLDVLYRPLLAGLLLAAFSFLLIVLDQVEGNPLVSLGLGLRSEGYAEQHRANVEDAGNPYSSQDNPATRTGRTDNVGLRLALRDGVVGTLIGFGMIAVAVVVIEIGGDLTFTVTLNAHTVALLGMVLVILITGALAEELMFRSYPFLQLQHATGRIGAVVITSALFGAVHLGNPNVSAWALMVTITVGVLLALARLRTGALWMPWGIHFGWNAALGLVFGLPVSGLYEFGVVVHGSARGPRRLTGGSYGLEASALGEIVIIAGIAAVALFVRERTSPRIYTGEHELK